MPARSPINPASVVSRPSPTTSPLGADVIRELNRGAADLSERFAVDFASVLCESS
jgi:hypothetical protein